MTVIHSTCWTLVALLMGGLLGTRAFGTDNGRTFDVATKIGGSLGVVEIETSPSSPLGKTKVESYTLGGVPFRICLYIDLWESLSLQLGPNILADVANTLILRQGLEFAALYHVIGGARRLNRSGDAVSILATTPSNLSLGILFGQYNYATRVEQVEFSGSVFETKLGVEYRRDISAEHALGAELYVTALTLPSSITRIRYQAVELLVFWRTYT